MKTNNISKIITISLLFFIALVLYFTVSKITLSEIGNKHVLFFHTNEFMEQCYNETKIKNIVSAISFNYRSMDTIGGLIILLTSVISICSLLYSPKNKKINITLDNTIFKIITILLTPLCLLFALYIWYSGENASGGGIPAGLMFGATTVMMEFAFGYDFIEKKNLFNIRIFLLSFSFIFIILIGTVGVFLNHNFFSYYFPEFFNTQNAEYISFFMQKLFSLNIAILIGMVTISLFYFMAGVE